jgi:ankyrin repeat protein
MRGRGACAAALPSVEAFLLASTKGDVATVQLFLRGGGDVNVTGAAGRTALMNAASRGQLEVTTMRLARHSVACLVD